MLRNLQFEIKLYVYDTALRNLEFEIEFYLVRQIPENTEVGHLLHIHCVLRLSVFYYVC